MSSLKKLFLSFRLQFPKLTFKKGFWGFLKDKVEIQNKIWKQITEKQIVISSSVPLSLLSKFKLQRILLTLSPNSPTSLCACVFLSLITPDGMLFITLALIYY